MYGFNKRCRHILAFVLNMILISAVQSQIAPDQEQLVEKVIRRSQSSAMVDDRPLRSYGYAERTTDFDSTLARRFQSVLDSMLMVHNIIGASAAVMMPDKGTWLGVYGMSDPARGDRIRSDMLFDIGSNTKTFIAAQVLLLAEQGLLTLDDPLDKWLPSYPNIDSTVTIRQLLNHTSGISDFSNENPAWGNDIDADYSRFWTPEYSLTYVLPPNFPPGKGWRYSNTNYVLAGMIIKKATGSDSVSTILRQQILDPLHLDHTFLDIEEQLTGELAKGWLYDSDHGVRLDFSQYPRTAIYSSLWTCGAMVSTAEDMATWVSALYTGDLLSPTSMDAMFTLVPFNDPVTYGYGLGTMKRVWLGEEMWLHGGDTVCFGSQAAYYPPRDAAIVVMLNQRNYPYQLFYDMIGEQLLRVLINYYQYPHDKAHPYLVKLSATFVKPLQDSLNIVAQINNPAGHRVAVMANVISTDEAHRDSTMLYDDGLHGDGQSGDGSYGGYWGPAPEENEFWVQISTLDLDDGYAHTLEESVHFTSMGPVVVDHYSFRSPDQQPHPGDRLLLKLVLANQGSSAAAADVAAMLVSLDTLVSIAGDVRSVGSLQPGEAKAADGFFRVQVADECPDSSEAPVAVRIKNNGRWFWSDTLSLLIVSKPATRMAEADHDVQREFSLSQNYPNPFNQSTVFSYQLPRKSHVTLELYNISGQKVSTLFAEEQEMGSHKYTWDAGDWAGGVYFCRLVADEFMQTMKLMILK